MLKRSCLGLGGLAALAVSALVVPQEASSGETGYTCQGKPATLVGTNGPDFFGGPDIDPNEVIVTRGGGDRVALGSERGVVVCGNAGRDNFGTDEAGPLVVLDGGTGNDTLGCQCFPDQVPRNRFHAIGGAGRDLLTGGGRDDVLEGGAGKDRLLGSFGEDLVEGGSQHDIMWGGADNDQVRGGDGDDRISGDLNPSELQHYGGGTDIANGGNGFDQCQAERQRDCEAS